MDMIRVTAKTLDEAITKALIELGTTSANLDYEIVEKGTSGLLGFIGGKPYVIEAKRKKSEEELEEIFTGMKKAETHKKTETFKKPETAKRPETSKKEDVPPKKAAFQKKEAPVKKEAAMQEEPPVIKETAENETQPAVSAKKSVDGTVYEEAAKKFLIQMFAAMNMDVEIQASYNEKEKELSVDMSGGDMGILIGKRGQTLDSLQYLVSLVVNKDCEGYVRVKLDTENYRARRKDTLEILAKNIAYKVKRTRRSVSLEPMNPYERRIIHAALQNDRYVVTRSEGEDPFRHVVISLKRDNRDRDYKNNQ